jgi:predicted transcriptional regulator
MSIRETRIYNDHRLASLFGLTHLQQAVAQYLAQAILEDKGSWWHSGEELAKEVNCSRPEANKAAKRLVELGLFSRSRKNRETAYSYSWAWLCPEGCEEASHRGKDVRKTYNPMKGNLATGSKQTKQVKREITTEQKEEVKRLSTSPQPFSCCEKEQTPLGDLHAEDCSHLAELEQGKAWSITREQNELAWAGWDSRQRQLAHLESFAKGMKRKQLRETQAQEDAESFEREFAECLAEMATSYGDPGEWTAWLKDVHRPTPERNYTRIGHEVMKRAVLYNKLGLALPTDKALASSFNPYPNIKVLGTDN